MPNIVPLPSDHGPWLAEIKTRKHAAKQQAALSRVKSLGKIRQLSKSLLDDCLEGTIWWCSAS